MAPKKAKVDPKQEAARLVIEERLVLEAKLDDEEVARMKIEKRLVLLAQKADREAAAAEKAEKERLEAERLRIEAERVARRLKLEAGLVSEAQQADAAIEAAIEAERLEQERQDLAALRSALGDAELVLTCRALTVQWEQIEPLFRCWGSEQIGPREFLAGLQLLNLVFDSGEVSRLFGSIAPSPHRVELRLLDVLLRRGGLGERARRAKRGHRDPIAPATASVPSAVPAAVPAATFASPRAPPAEPPLPEPLQGRRAPSRAPTLRAPPLHYHRTPRRMEPSAVISPPKRPATAPVPSHRSAPAAPPSAFPAAKRNARLSMAWPPSCAPPTMPPPPHMLYGGYYAPQPRVAAQPPRWHAEPATKPARPQSAAQPTTALGTGSRAGAPRPASAQLTTPLPRGFVASIAPPHWAQLGLSMSMQKQLDLIAF
jgi:hypothetical protein